MNCYLHHNTTVVDLAPLSPKQLIPRASRADVYSVLHTRCPVRLPYQVLGEYVDGLIKDIILMDPYIQKEEIVKYGY